MATGEVVSASAGRHYAVRPMTPDEASEYAEHSELVKHLISTGHGDGVPDFRLKVKDGEIFDDAEHGMGKGATLCGIPEEDVFVMRHLFDPDGPLACPDCAAVARRESA